MKKVILSAAVVVLGLAATSCKKSYVCECYTSTSTTPTFTTVKESNQTNANNTCYKMGDQVSKSCHLTY